MEEYKQRNQDHLPLNIMSEGSSISRRDSNFSEENEMNLKHDSDSSSRALRHTSTPETLLQSGFGSGVFKSVLGGQHSSKELSMDICSADGSQEASTLQSKDQIFRS